MENKRLNYRFRIDVPDIPYNMVGFSPVFCDISAADWESLSWGRYGSGGDFSCRHLFVDDWRLEHLWRRQGPGILKVSQYDFVTAPDFRLKRIFLLLWCSIRCGGLLRWRGFGCPMVSGLFLFFSGVPLIHFICA